MFQVLEHLKFRDVVEVFGEVRRVLAPGGVFIAEVPNLSTLRVGASTFWIDPTHERPLHPLLLEFLAEQSGFSAVSRIESNPLVPMPDLGDFPPELSAIVTSLHSAINGPGDFALIARA